MSSTKNFNPVIEQLQELKRLQSFGDAIYPDGIFPSQRHHPFLPYQREDDNLFFTASVVHILQGIESALEDEEKQFFKAIESKAIAAYGLFKNKDGLDTFNFWQTKPSRHFPNGLFMHRFKHFQIPDDVDDTSLVYLTENRSKTKVNWLRKKLKLHANKATKQAYNPLPKYRDLNCYSTFFGEKMYIEFDVCVLCNLMRLILSRVEENGLDEYDLGTLDFIQSTVVNKEFKTLPFYSSPNYPTTALILYHLARLVPHLPQAYKDKVEPIVISAIKEELKLINGINKLLLENAAVKLGVRNSFTNWNNEVLEDAEFFFFHAGMITAFENAIAQKLASNSFFHLRYTSKALNRALLIENMVLKRALTL